MSCLKNSQMLAILALVALFIAGCTGDKKVDEDLPPSKTHYTLKVGEKINHGAPLPSQSQIMVTWHMSDGTTNKVHGFNGWDFNKDGRYDMVEVLDEKGKVQNLVFDFDGDGVVDAVKEAH